MATIKIHNWKVVDEDDTNALVLVPPEYHPTYWEVPKWWYKGDRTVYTSCARVDLNDETSIYIDGTSPLMQLTLDYDGDNLRGSDWRDIRRVLVCAKGDLGAINRGDSDAYDDVEFFRDYYITRVDNYAPKVIDPLITVLKPVFYSELPVAAGSSTPFDTGTWRGGVEPVTYEWRYRAQEYKSDIWYSVGDWKAQPNEAIQETLSLPDDSDAWYIHIESRAVDAEGTTVYNNSDPRRALHRVKKEPGTIVKYSDFNTYEEGSEIVFETATFYGGVPPVQYRHRIQQRNTPEDSWTNGNWTQYDNTVQTRRETITFPAGTTARIQCQAVDSAKDGQTSAQANGDIKTIVAPSPAPLAPIRTLVDSVPYQQNQGALFLNASQQVVLSVETSAASQNFNKTYTWSKQSGAGQFITATDQQSVTYEAGGPGCGAVIVCQIESDLGTDSPQLSQVIQFFVA